MANTKKYLDLAGLQAYDVLIKGVITALENGKVKDNATAIATLNSEATVEGSVKKTVADAVAAVVASAPEDFDTLKEIADWIAADKTRAADLTTKVSANETAIAGLKTLVGSLPEGITATDVVGYIAEAVKTEADRAKGVEEGLDTRLAAVEAKFTGEESVAKQIEDAVNAEKTRAEKAEKANADDIAAINNTETGILAQAKSDATTKANTAEQNAKAYADGLNGNIGSIDSADINALFS